MQLLYLLLVVVSDVSDVKVMSSTVAVIFRRRRFWQATHGCIVP